MEHGEVHDLFEHMEWADALTWRSTVALPPAAQDSRLLDLFYHLHTVQWIYLQVWQGDRLHVPDRMSLAELTAIGEWARPYYGALRSFVGGLRPEQLSRGIAFPWADEVAKRLGSAAPATLGESILQVVMHSTYHRGQLATRIRELGGEPPLTDFIAWVWRAKPAAEW
jgi:uncharacterized damage-inducible protein DinB